jgi:tetratricopeptide (TPR) repeat protein
METITYSEDPNTKSSRTRPFELSRPGPSKKHLYLVARFMSALTANLNSTPGKLLGAFIGDALGAPDVEALPVPPKKTAGKKTTTRAQDCDKYVEAEALYRRCLQGREKTLGPEHTDTLESTMNLGVLLQKRGNLEEAEPLLRRALAGQDRTLGADHTATLVSVYNLGTLLQASGQLNEAEALYRRALEGRERTLGPDHADTVSTVYNLGMLLQERGKLDEAEPLLHCILERRERTLGPDHPDTLLSVRNLGVMLYNRNRFEEAERLFRPAHKRFINTFGPAHSNTRDVAKVLDFLKMKNIGRHLKKQKPNDKCACGSGRKYKKCCKNK